MSTTTLNQSRLTRLSARFAPVFATIAAGAAARDADRSLPYQEIRELAASGFGALRVPESHGGAGATLPELFSLLTDLAAADPNLTQALRAHFAFVEDRLVAAEGPERERWLERFAAGELVGNSWTDSGSATSSSTWRSSPQRGCCPRPMGPPGCLPSSSTGATRAGWRSLGVGTAPT